MSIKYNTTIEVTQKQYNVCMNNLKGITAGRISEGKYFIKVFWMKYKKEVNRVLTEY